MNQFDHFLDQWAREPLEITQLDRLERDVWQRIKNEGAKRSEVRFLAGLRMAAASFALLVGVTVGGTQAWAVLQAPHEMSIFSSKANLIVSTLLQ